MIRTILVPLDGSTFGEHALPVALSIARRARASLSLVRVLPAFASEVLEHGAQRSLVKSEYHRETELYLKRVAERIQEVDSLTVTVHVGEGEIADAIRGAVEAGFADLVVMTTHGRGPLARFWLGSISDELIRELPIPLLLVHPSEQPPDLTADLALERILIPLDGTPLSEQMIAPATELARAMNGCCILVRAVQTDIPANLAFEPGGEVAAQHVHFMVDELEAVRQRHKLEAEAYLARIAEGIRAEGVQVETRVVLDEPPTEAILTEAKWGCDLIALETHGFSGLKRLWSGSVADKVIRGSHAPVLVQRPASDPSA